MKDIFKDYRWHSCIEPSQETPKKRIVRSLAATDENKAKFTKISDGGNVLIHKSSQALWRFSDDGKRIEPLYQDNPTTEDEL